MWGIEVWIGSRTLGGDECDKQYIRRKTHELIVLRFCVRGVMQYLIWVGLWLIRSKPSGHVPTLPGMLPRRTSQLVMIVGSVIQVRDLLVGH